MGNKKTRGEKRIARVTGARQKVREDLGSAAAGQPVPDFPKVPASAGRKTPGWTEEERRSAPLVDEILTDDRIYGVAMTRIGAILSAPMKFQPAKTADREQEIADEIGGSNDRRGVWEQMFSTAAAAKILKWGQHLGLGFATRAAQRKARYWKNRAKELAKLKASRAKHKAKRWHGRNRGHAGRERRLLQRQ